MVQVINAPITQRSPRTSALLGQALGNVFKAGGDIMLQDKLQNMMQDQQVRRNEQMNLQAFGKSYGGIDPKVASALRKMELEYQDRSNTQKAVDEMYGIGTKDDRTSFPSRVSQSLQGVGQEPRELPPGKEMMLPYEDMPAEETIVQPRAIEGPRKAIPEQRMSPSEKYESGKTKLDQQFQRNMQSYRGPHPEKITAAYNARLQALERQRTNEETAESRRFKERQEEEKKPKEYIDKLDSQYESSLSKRPTLQMMEAKAGELPDSSVYKKYITERLKLPSGFLFNDTEQIIDKLGNQLIQGVSSSFDQARILQTEVETFIKANPSLMNTPEGLQKISKIVQVYDEIVEDKWKYKNQLVKKYRKEGKNIPEDFRAKILKQEPKFIEKANKKIEKIMAVKGIERKKFEVGQDLNTLPKTAPRGTRIQTPSGKIVKFNGMNWEEE